MADKTHVIEVSTERAAPLPANRDTLLKDVIARICQDSQEESEHYLEETKVPHGGE